MKIKSLLSALGLAVLCSSVAMASSTGNVFQEGSHNDALITQSFNTGANADVNVEGYHNNTYVTQENSSNVDASIKVTNWGSHNSGVISTTNVNNGTATIAVYGGDHEKASIQQSGQGSWWGGTVKGENLHASITQEMGAHNDAWIMQSGKNHDAGIYQTGYHNEAGIEQKGTGSNNLARITQDGTHNDGYISQRGGGLTANMTQVGHHNVASIIQQ